MKDVLRVHSWRGAGKGELFDLYLSNVNRLIPLFAPCGLLTSGRFGSLIHMTLTISVIAHIIPVRACSPPDTRTTGSVGEGGRVAHGRARSKIRRGDSIYGLVPRVVSNESRCGRSIGIVRIEISHRIGRPRLLVSCNKHQYIGVTIS